MSEIAMPQRVKSANRHNSRVRTSGFYLASVAAATLALTSSSAFACGGFFDAACNLSHGGMDPSNLGKQTETVAHQVGDTGEKALHDTGHTMEKAGQDFGHTAEKAVQDTGKTIEKAVQDTGKAGETVYKFGLREIESIGTMVTDAGKRLQEGKVVDAIWHFTTDPVKHTEENAAKAAQESDLVRVAGQIAASAYGGPGGAAAYAAWLTYNQTKDVGLALRVGAITGAAAYGTGAVGNIPNAKAGIPNAGLIAEKTIMAGAIGGVAVAAAGGDKQAIQEGFLKSGGAVLVQSLYEVETQHKLDARMSKGKAYCMAATDPTVPCAPPVEAYKEIGPDGKAVTDENGMPKVDVRKTDPRAPHVGTWAKPGEAPTVGTQETSGFMITVSKYPGMNAMALLHDHLSYTLKFDPVTNVWTIVPATVVTYYGTDVPTNDQIRKAAEDNQKSAH